MESAQATGLLAPDSEMAAQEVADAFGASARAIVHYGSRVHGAGVRASSEYDFVVIVDEYVDAMQSIVATTRQRFSSVTATLLSRVLAPTIIAVTLSNAPDSCAKCIVYSERDFDRACGPRSPDHFLKGRLFQKVIVAWYRDDISLAHATGGIERCRDATLDWVSASLPREFDTPTFCKTLFQTSYAAEIRPERGTRALEVFASQEQELVPMYHNLLMRWAEDGRLIAGDDPFVLVGPPDAALRTEWRRYFRISKARATARWVKSAWLYRGWMTYLTRKTQRRALRRASKERTT